MNAVAQLAFGLTEQGFVPDALVRVGIRRLVEARLREIHAADCETAAVGQLTHLRDMATAAIAPLPQRANAQHYELPAAFFAAVLGAHRKYSCCHWPQGVETLDEAEAAGLAATCERAGLQDGMDILELGCGWGSLSLWMASRYPASRVTAVSNSHSQRSCIEAQAAERGIGNLTVLTRDINEFDIGQTFDAVVSVEMFEHARNWARLFDKVSSWLRPHGRFFMHIFVHRAVPYAFEDNHATDWMSRHFFSGGMMPSDDLPLFFQDRLELKERWRWDGTHYEKTANAWLANMDASKTELWPLFEQTYGRDFARLWWTRWRLFFMACAELFGYDDGQQWWVSHYLFGRRG